MDKLKLLARELDGVTVVAQAPTFQLVNGWSQATLTTPAGILPAGLWGKVPGGDPYLLHINVLTTAPLNTGDFVELQSGPPVQPRRQYRPTPDNTFLCFFPQFWIAGENLGLANGPLAAHFSWQ